MGKSVLSFDPATTPLDGANIVYLLQGSGLDRDRKVTLEQLRQYFTGQWNEFMQAATADAVNTGTAQNPHWVLTKDISSTANVILIVHGNGSVPLDLNLIGSIPVGCKLTIINWNPALVTLTSNKAMTGGGTMHNLDWAEFIWSAQNKWYAIVIPARDSVTSEIASAVFAERQRASTAEGELAQDLGEEATTRYNADYTLTMNLNQEASNRSNADILLDQRLTAIEAWPTEIEQLHIVAADISILRWVEATKIAEHTNFWLRRRNGFLDIQFELFLNATAAGWAASEIVVQCLTSSALWTDLLERIAAQKIDLSYAMGSMFDAPGIIVPAIISNGRTVAGNESMCAYLRVNENDASKLSILFFSRNLLEVNSLNWPEVISGTTKGGIIFQHLLL